MWYPSVFIVLVNHLLASYGVSSIPMDFFTPEPSVQFEGTVNPFNLAAKNISVFPTLDDLADF